MNRSEALKQLSAFPTTSRQNRLVALSFPHEDASGSLLTINTLKGEEHSDQSRLIRIRCNANEKTGHTPKHINDIKRDGERHGR